MPLIDITLPTLGDTIRSVRRAFNGQYRSTLGLDAFRPTNALFPLSLILARIGAQVDRRGVEAASQATPFGATGKNLVAWLDVHGVAIPPAAKATGTVNVTGESATLEANTILSSGADGTLWETDAQVVFSSPEETLSVAITALEVGTAGNREPNDVLELSAVPAGIQTEATVVTLTGGNDPADDASLLALLQARLAQSNTSGTGADYALKSLLTDNSLRTVYIVEAGKGAGTISMYPTNKLTSSQDSYEVNVSSAGQISNLQTYWDDESNRKVNDRPFVLSLTLVAHTFDVTITPDNADTRAAVEDALGNRLAQDYSAKGYTVANSELSAAIGNAAGVTSHTLNDVNGNGATADAVAALGELATRGVVTFS